MQRIFTLFRPLFERNYFNPFAVIIVCVLAAVLSGYFAIQLKIDTDIAYLLPES